MDRSGRPSATEQPGLELVALEPRGGEQRKARAARSVMAPAINAGEVAVAKGEMELASLVAEFGRLKSKADAMYARIKTFQATVRQTNNAQRANRVRTAAVGSQPLVPQALAALPNDVVTPPLPQRHPVPQSVRLAGPPPPIRNPIALSRGQTCGPTQHTQRASLGLNCAEDGICRTKLSALDLVDGAHALAMSRPQSTLGGGR